MCLEGTENVNVSKEVKITDQSTQQRSQYTFTVTIADVGEGLM